MSIKEQPHCPECGSDDVGVEATASWDVEQQDWIIAYVYDDKFCRACDAEFKYADWRKVT